VQSSRRPLPIEDRRPMPITPNQPQPSVSSVPSVRNPTHPPGPSSISTGVTGPSLRPPRVPVSRPVGEAAGDCRAGCLRSRLAVVEEGGTWTMHIDHSHRKLTSGVPQTSSDGHSWDMDGGRRSLRAVDDVDESQSDDRRPTSITPRSIPLLRVLRALREKPDPPTRAVIDLNRSDMPESSNTPECPSVDPERETAELVALRSRLAVVEGGGTWRMHIDHAQRRLTSGVPQTSYDGHSCETDG